MSVVISKIFHGAPESPPKPLLRKEQVAEKPHDSMGIRCVLSLSWRCRLLGLNDVVAAKTARSAPQRLERSGNLPRDWRSVGTTSEESNRDMSLDDQKAKSGRFLAPD